MIFYISIFYDILSLVLDFEQFGGLMILTELTAGAPVTLQMQIDDNTYDFSSAVVSVRPDSILINPITYNNAPIDLGQKKGIMFNLFAIDPSTESRVMWKNISIETVSYSNNSFWSSYYKITINFFARASVPADRRSTKRIVLNIPGMLTLDSDEYQRQITIYDISDHGISFTTLEKFELPSNSIYLSFSDDANGHEFHLRFQCIVVRTMAQGLVTTYGCNVIKPTRDFLNYVFLKKILAKIEADAANKKQEDIDKEKQQASATARTFSETISTTEPHSGMGLYSSSEVKK